MARASFTGQISVSSGLKGMAFRYTEHHSKVSNVPAGECSLLLFSCGGCNSRFSITFSYHDNIGETKVV